MVHLSANSFGAKAIAATNASVTYTNASTIYVHGAPTAGSNVTITNPWAMYVAGGKSYFGADVSVGTGDLSFTGTAQRATYTCVGDVVNLASRLEGHTKVVGQPILIDAYTRQHLDQDIQVEAQGAFQAKGKSQSVEVFSVLDILQRVS